MTPTAMNKKKRGMAKSVMLGLIVSLAVNTKLGASDLSGQWTFAMDPGSPGNPATMTCALKQNGPKLIVKCGNGTGEMHGEVNERRVRFRSPARTEKKPRYVLSFDGEVGAGAKTLDGQWRAVFLLTESSEVRTGKFSAKRR